MKFYQWHVRCYCFFFYCNYHFNLDADTESDFCCLWCAMVFSKCFDSRTKELLVRCWWKIDAHHVHIFDDRSRQRKHCRMEIVSWRPWFGIFTSIIFWWCSRVHKLMTDRKKIGPPNGLHMQAIHKLTIIVTFHKNTKNFKPLIVLSLGQIVWEYC